MLEDRGFVELPPAQMDEAQVAFAQNTHKLLESYVDERLAKPLVESVTTYAYLTEFLQLLELVSEESSDKAVYLDTILLVKCFAATVLSSPEGSQHMFSVLDWIQSVDSVVGRWPADAFQQVLSLESPAAAPWFWEYVQNCVLCGRLEDATKLILKAEPNASPEIQDLVWLLEAYPLTGKYTSFMQWRQNALALHNNLQDSALTDHTRPIVSIIGVLIGDVDVINNISDSWMLSVAALYLYNDPTPEMLPQHFAAAVAKHTVNSEITWEEGCQALFESRVVAALSCLRALDLTSAIAITEFSSEHGVLEKYAATSGKAGGGIRERLAIQYARICLAEPELVDIGVELLANVATPMAKEAASVLLPQLANRSYESAPISIELSQRLGLPKLRQELCHIAAQVAASEKRYASAVHYLYEAGDLAAMRDLSLDFFKEMLVARKPIGDDHTLELLREPSQVGELGLPLAVRDSLAPDAVLLQLLDALNSEDVEAIAINLSALLKFPIQRPEFYPLLVALAGDLSGEVIATETSVLLMQALSEWDNTSSATKDSSYALITDAMQQPEWQKVLHPGYRPTEVVWLLRRNLAKEVVI